MDAEGGLACHDVGAGVCLSYGREVSPLDGYADWIVVRILMMDVALVVIV